MSSKVYKKFLTRLSSTNLEKAELTSNYRKLTKLEFKKNCGAFFCFIFKSIILNEYKKSLLRQNI